MSFPSVDLLKDLVIYGLYINSNLEDFNSEMTAITSSGVNFQPTININKTLRPLLIKQYSSTAENERKKYLEANRDALVPIMVGFYQYFKHRENYNFFTSTKELLVQGIIDFLGEEPLTAGIKHTDTKDSYPTWEKIVHHYFSQITFDTIPDDTLTAFAKYVDKTNKYAFDIWGVFRNSFGLTVKFQAYGNLGEQTLNLGDKKYLGAMHEIRQHLFNESVKDDPLYPLKALLVMVVIIVSVVGIAIVVLIVALRTGYILAARRDLPWYEGLKFWRLAKFPEKALE